MNEEGLDMLRQLADRHDDTSRTRDIEPPKPEPPNVPYFYRRREAHRTFLRFLPRVAGRQRCR